MSTPVSLSLLLVLSVSVGAKDRVRKATDPTVGPRPRFRYWVHSSPEDIRVPPGSTPGTLNAKTKKGHKPGSVEVVPRRGRSVYLTPFGPILSLKITQTDPLTTQTRTVSPGRGSLTVDVGLCEDPSSTPYKSRPCQIPSTCVTRRHSRSYSWE